MSSYVRPFIHTLYTHVHVGPASVVCIETLRQDGYQGKILLCSREDSLPYDRPKLSKVSSYLEP